MPIASLSDYQKDESKDPRSVNSYAGGTKSGMALESGPTDDAFKRMQEQMGAPDKPLPGDAVTVTIYADGFTVGNGPFRPSTDPLNKKFLDEMAAGVCPQELQAMGGQGPDGVHVAVVDKRSEQYKGPAGGAAAPAAPAKPNYFSGEGNSLSSGSASTSASVAVSADKGSVAIEEGKAKTKVQIRFHDGSRKAQEFNEDHTIGDLRKFCSDCANGQAMQIMGGFPPKPLADDSITLKAAGICGAAVTARPA